MNNYIFVLVNKEGKYFYIGEDGFYTGFYDHIVSATIFDYNTYSYYKNSYNLDALKKVFFKRVSHNIKF